VGFEVCCPIRTGNAEALGKGEKVDSESSATGMSPLSPQGWVYGVFAFNLLSLSLPQVSTDDLLSPCDKLS
jgi:hypothetical protein